MKMIIANIYNLRDGVNVSGRIENGTVSVGDNLIVTTGSGDISVKVIAIQGFQKSLNTASVDAGLVSINIGDIDVDLISNRDILHS